MVQNIYISRLAQHQHLLKIHHVVGQSRLWGGYFFVSVAPSITVSAPSFKGFQTNFSKNGQPKDTVKF